MTVCLLLRRPAEVDAADALDMLQHPDVVRWNWTLIVVFLVPPVHLVPADFVGNPLALPGVLRSEQCRRQ